jgi:uncharacterized protein
MAQFLLAFGAILLAVAGLALGVIFGRAPIKGSCGGLSCGLGAGCGACPRHGEKGEGS